VKLVLFYIAAKQEAFEESIKLKNQFRKLDDDEVDFLDSVLESTRAKEDAVKRETVEQLRLFRKQQEETDKSMHHILGSETLGQDDSVITGEGTPQFSIARKRKRVKGSELLKGVKLRRTSSGEAKSSVIAKSPTSVKNVVDTVPGSGAVDSEKTKEQPLDAAPTCKVNSTARTPQKPALSLIDYASEDEEDPN
jgi:hypothetical protein